MAYVGANAEEVNPIEVENLGALAPLVIPELPGCDDLMVRQKLGYALREFCRETDACVLAQRFSGDENGSVFVVTMIPADMIFGKMLKVSVNGVDMDPGAFDKSYAPNVVKANWSRVLTADDKVVIHYSVYPKIGGESCPRWFMERYSEAITAGAMYHLLSMTGRKWSDPARASQYGITYQNAVSDAAYYRAEKTSPDGQMTAIPCGGLFI